MKQQIAETSYFYYLTIYIPWTEVILTYLRIRSLQQAPYDYCQQIIKTIIIITNDKITFSLHQAFYFMFKKYILVYLQ
jgi:hypothetical protein